jgi:hypothetical protein
MQIGALFMHVVACTLFGHTHAGSLVKIAFYVLVVHIYLRDDLHVNLAVFRL